MRPRKNSFGTMPFSDFKKLMTERKVWGFIVKETKDILTYTFHMMFRDNKRPPETLEVDVSTRSKNVIKVRSDRRTFLNLDDVLEKTMMRSS